MTNEGEYTPGEKYLKNYVVLNSDKEHCVRMPDAFEAVNIERKAMIDKAWDWISTYVLCTIPLECQKVVEKEFRKEMEE